MFREGYASKIFADIAKFLMEEKQKRDKQEADGHNDNQNENKETNDKNNEVGKQDI